MINKPLLKKKYNGLEELLNIEVMSTYNSFIVKKALKHVKNPERVVDFGAGIGTLPIIFRNLHQIEPVCVEADRINQKYIKKRNFKILDNLSDLNFKADLIFSSNVLEHIEDDLSILKQFRDHLSNCGKLFLYLPANMFLWSKLDESVGHYRRYSYNEIKNKCINAGFKIDVIYFADCIGFIASIAMKLFGYKSMVGLGSLSSLKFYDKWIFPISKFLDEIGIKYLFGKNLILVASKN